MANQFIKNLRESVKHWYLPLITGLILIGTGIWTFFSPQESYLALSIVFSVSFLVTGVFEIIFAISNRNTMDNWGWTLVLGILTTLVGVMLLNNPEISLISLPLYVGFMLMFRAISAMGMAMDLKSYGVMEWGTLMIFGVLGLIFSFIMIWNPIFAGMTLVFWTGAALLASGIFNVYLAIKMRKLHKNWDSISAEAKQKYEEVRDAILSELGRR